MSLKVTFIGKPNLQVFGETLARFLAAKQGLELVPGSVVVVKKDGSIYDPEKEKEASA